MRLAEIVADVVAATADVSTEKPADVDPDGTLTCDGTDAAEELDDRATVPPWVLVSSTVPVVEAPPATDEAARVIELSSAVAGGLLAPDTTRENACEPDGISPPPLCVTVSV